MHFMSKYHKEIKKEKKKIDIDKIFNLKKNKDIILPLGSCFLDEFCYHLDNNNFKICSQKKNNHIIKMDRQTNEKGFQFFFEEKNMCIFFVVILLDVYLHDKFFNMGIDKIRSLGKKDCFLYDLKSMFNSDETNLRL